MSRLSPPDLPSTAEHPAIQPATTRRPFGVRLWLALMFAAIGTLTGTSVYLFVSESSESAAEERAADIAQGRALDLARDLGSAPEGNSGRVVARYRSESFAAWVFGENGNLKTEEIVPAAGGVALDQVPGRDGAVETALNGRSFLAELEDGTVVVALPIFRDDVMGADGAVLVQAERPREVEEALGALRGERLTGLGIAVLVAAIIGFLVASLITTRVKRLAAASERIAQGDLSEPLHPRGRDEIGDLGRALDSMRVALAESFDALSSERDRLSAIFVSLEDAVIVVGSDGDVRFANPAGAEYITSDGKPAEELRPWVRRASHRGTIENDHVSAGERTVGISARHLPAESAVLIVVRDRTEELRRDEAEREFVSNAAHELRNPIAGMSGAIEVLRSGAKDDPEARDHFLERLSNDVDRVSRLTKSLLTLARMEAIGEGEADVVSVDMVMRDSSTTAEPPEGLTLLVDGGEELVAQADPVLLRQVVIGLLTNAYKHTPPPGTVTLRAYREDEEIVIEVQDTGGGIPAEERDRVFERFYRGSGSLEREGFGLGLAIAKRMIDVMGGEITVESEEGRGSKFTIRLKEAQPSPAPVA
ncbi:MAG TPA: ATP-binding protein [Solirubrobacterales bacterium]|nr:ATP-binding protein [Solirubrobacterales bacterium]